MYNCTRIQILLYKFFSKYYVGRKWTLSDIEWNVYRVDGLVHRYRNIPNFTDINKCTIQSTRKKIYRYPPDVSQNVDNRFSSASQYRDEEDKLTIQGLSVIANILQILFRDACSSLWFVSEGSLDNNSAYVYVMLWRQTGNKALPEPIITTVYDNLWRR